MEDINPEDEDDQGEDQGEYQGENQEEDQGEDQGDPTGIETDKTGIEKTTEKILEAPKAVGKAHHGAVEKKHKNAGMELSTK